MLLLIINTLALLWIFYRVVFARAFLVWDWSDGKMEFVWNKERWNASRMR